MQYSLLGNTGLIVSRLAVGAMTFTAGNKRVPTIARVDPPAVDMLVGQALDAGVNFFDTADLYAGGEAETLLGSALRARRHDVVIATKAGMRMSGMLTDRGLSRHHLLGSIDNSLKRLGTDYVDVYIAHRDDPWTPLEETLSALDAIVRSGKARYIGFSNWPAWKVAAAMEMQRANGWATFSHGQMCYSLIDRDIEHEVVPMMRHFGLGLTAWSPLSSGLLSGKYTRENMADPENRLSQPVMLLIDPEIGLRVVEKIRPIAASRGATVAQVALAWLLSRDLVNSIILGVARASQLEDNLGAVHVALSEEDLATLDAAARPAPIYPNTVLEALTDRKTVAALGRGDRTASQR